jgi:cell division septation protein DedD
MEGGMLVGVIIGLAVTLGIFTVVNSHPQDENQKAVERTVEQPAERFYYSADNVANQTQKMIADEEFEKAEKARKELEKSKAELAKVERAKADLAKDEQIKAEFFKSQLAKAEAARLKAENDRLENERIRAELARKHAELVAAKEASEKRLLDEAEIEKARIEAREKAKSEMNEPPYQQTLVETKSTLETAEHKEAAKPTTGVIHVEAATVAPLPAKPTEERQVAMVKENGWGVQVASLKTQKDADEKLALVQAKGFKAYIEQADVQGSQVFRVKVGPSASKAEAQALRKQVIQHPEFSGAFITK